MTDGDLREFRVLRAPEGFGTVGATAEALRMTPSAVSRRSSSLSRQVGVDLPDLALPSHHRLASSRALLPHDLAKKPWIYGATGPWRDVTVSACAQAGFALAQAGVASDRRAIPNMVAAGRGVAMIPRLVAVNDAPGVRPRILRSDRPRRHVVSAVRSGSGERPQVTAVPRALEDTAAELDEKNVRYFRTVRS